MIIREEEQTQILREKISLHLSKLLSMKEHLKALIAKKYRIDIEIKSLRKSMRDKSIMSTRDIKMSLSAEESEIFTPDSSQYKILKDAGLLSEIQQLDEVELFLREVDDLQLSDLRE